MNKKCIGCGAVLQEANVLIEGYTVSLENIYVKDVLKLDIMENQKTITKSNEEYINILKMLVKQMIQFYMLQIYLLRRRFIKDQKYIT